MKTYKINFAGRLHSAIGATYPQPEETIRAESKEAAILRLYDRFDHIRIYSIIEVTE